MVRKGWLFFGLLLLLATGLIQGYAVKEVYGAWIAAAVTAAGVAGFAAAGRGALDALADKAYMAVIERLKDRFGPPGGR